MAIKLIKNAVPQTSTGKKNVDHNIWRIQTFPPILEYKDPLK